MKIKLIINADVTEAGPHDFTSSFYRWVDLLFPAQSTYSVYYLDIALLILHRGPKEKFLPLNKRSTPLR